jgi:hypothetical protein
MSQLRRSFFFIFATIIISTDPAQLASPAVIRPLYCALMRIKSASEAP